MEEKAKLVRKWCLISTTQAGSGHPTTCLSAADLMTVFFDKYYSYNLQDPKNIANDRLIFSKGHAAPLLYALYSLSGAFPVEQLKTLRKIDSPLEGHPTPEFPYTEAATGSLGQGLSVGAGLAIAIQREDSLVKKPHVFVLLGDGELAEGQVWEAANFATYYKLNNLIAIVDINRLGQSQETMFGHRIENYSNRFQSFGWEVISINGHDLAAIDNAFQKAIMNMTDKPVVILAQTQKGHGISLLTDKEGWHGKPLLKDKLEEALSELGNVEDKQVFSLKKPDNVVVREHRGELIGVASSTSSSFNDISISYNLGDMVATREVYGNVLTKMGNTNKNIVALDAEVKNSTYAIDFMKVYPERFIECFIAEQNMVSVAAGLARFGKIPFVSTFAAFFMRAADQIRMAWLSQANIKFIGSHAGSSIGEDGSSQMGLEEISMFGTLPGVIVLQPSDALSMTKLLQLVALTPGMAYIQTLRSKTAVLYGENEEFIVGGSKVLKSSEKDSLIIAATGITVHEALKAYELLQAENIFVRIIDCYSISPLDKEGLLKAVNETKQRIIITVEDHFIHGGLGGFVSEAMGQDNVQIESIGVIHHAHSGTSQEVMNYVGISAQQIVEKVKKLLS